jgi:hypothetical protein
MQDNRSLRLHDDGRAWFDQCASETTVFEGKAGLRAPLT